MSISQGNEQLSAAAASQLSKLPEDTSSSSLLAKVDLYLKITQSGGSVENIIRGLNVGINNFLRSYDNKITFEFVENTKSFDGKKFFDKGSATVVYKIRGSDGIIYILRAMDPSEFYKYSESSDHKKSMDESITKFIEKYEEDLRLFGHHMIEIFHYGTIFSGAVADGKATSGSADAVADGKATSGAADADAIPVCPYVITKVYKNRSDILQLPLQLKVAFFKQLLTFNAYLDRVKYVYRDLKLSNIGYELLPTGEIKFIILDYDMVTLVKKSDYNKEYNYSNPVDRKSYKLLGLANSRGIGYLIHGRLPYGTYPPPYLLDYFSLEKQEEILEKLDKISSGGIVNVLSNVFELVPPQTLLSYQLKIVDYFDRPCPKPIKPQKKQELHNIIINCPTLNFTDLQIKLKNHMLIPLTNMNYGDILTPNQTLEIFDKIILEPSTPLHGDLPTATASAALHGDLPTATASAALHGDLTTATASAALHGDLPSATASAALHGDLPTATASAALHGDLPVGNTSQSKNKYLKYKQKYLALKKLIK